MYTPEDRLPPGQWRAGEQSETKLEYVSPVECWTGLKLVRVAALRVTCGAAHNAFGPLWVLQVTTGTGDFATTDRFGTAGCRSDAREKLFEAMESIDRLIKCADGRIGHRRIVTLLEKDYPVARIQ